MTGPDPGRSFGPDFLNELFRNPLDPGYADAARRRARTGPRTGWRRRCTRSVALVVLLALGFLLAVAYRQTLAEEPARTTARAGLVEQVQSRQARSDELQRTADRLRIEVAGLRDAALSGTAAAQLRDLEAGTGLARVRGDGVVIRLADGSAPADAVTGNKPNLSRVFDRDLQDLANALWAEGAEAIAVNGQRLTATATIRAAGAAIMVDDRPVTSPYEVAAIGPEDLDERIVATPAGRLFRRLASDVGMGFDVRRVEGLTLPAAAGSRLRFARPSPAPAPSSAAPSSPVPSGDVGASAGPGDPAATGRAQGPASSSSNPEGGR